MLSKTNRCLLLAALVALSGCAAVFPPETEFTIAAGSTVATTSDPVQLKRMLVVRDSLHTPEMNAAIAAARR